MRALTILVTGGAGFIGSAVVRQLDPRDGAEVVNVDKLTYAGNLESLAEAADDPRHHFERVDICDADEVARVFERAPARRRDAPGGRVARRPLDRRPRRVHPDQRRRHLHPAPGRPGLLAGAGRRRARRASASSTSRPTRSTARSAPTGFFTEETPYEPELALLGEQGGVRPPRPRLAPHLRPADARDQLLEQLRPVPVPRETDPAGDPQRHGGQAPADLRQGRQRPRLAVRRGPRPGPPPGAGEGHAGRDLQHRRPQRADQPRGRPGDLHAARRAGARLAPRPARRPDHVRRRPPGPRRPLRHRRRQDRRASWAGGPRETLRDGPAQDGRLVSGTSRVVRATSSRAATAGERPRAGGRR